MRAPRKARLQSCFAIAICMLLLGSWPLPPDCTAQVPDKDNECCIPAPGSLTAQTAQAPDTKDTRKIGVLAFRGHEEALRQWGPVADYLTGSIPGHTFRIVPLDFGTVDFFLQNSGVDFLLTNPGNFVLQMETHDLTPLLTVETQSGKIKTNKFGSVIFTRADRTDIIKIADLKGKSFMAVDPLSFGGWWMAWREIKDSGLNPYSDFAILRFSGFPHDNVVYAVLDGKVDAGTVRSGMLERMAEEGKIDPADLRIIEPKLYPPFSFATSTRLYPEWTFASLKHVDKDLTRKVTSALLALDPESAPARAAHIAGFSTDIDLKDVFSCLEELHIWFVEYTSPSAVYRRYKPLIFALAAAFAAITALAIYALRLNIRLKKSFSETALAKETLNEKNKMLLELSHSLEEKINTEVEASRHKDLMLINQSHLANLGRLAAGITHEINTPLTYAKGNLELLQRQILRTMPDDQKTVFDRFIAPISDGIDRIATIVDSMKEISGIMRGYKESVEVNLYTTLIYAARMVHTQAKHVAPLHINGVPFSVALDRNAESYPMRLRSHNVEQVWLVLLNNAMEAFADTTLPFEERKIDISIGTQSGKITVTFRDNAGGIPEDKIDSIFDMFMTTKPTGSGIGLHVAKTIITGMGAEISARNEGGWAVFEVVFQNMEQGG